MFSCGVAGNSSTGSVARDSCLVEGGTGDSSSHVELLEINLLAVLQEIRVFWRRSWRFVSLGTPRHVDR